MHRTNGLSDSWTNCYIGPLGKGKKGKGTVAVNGELHDTATECHLPYGITQCHLLPDTSEHTPARQAGTRFTYHLRMEG